MIARALTIAGSDSGGGAGIQADLKTFSMFGVYGASALTAVTAQNTMNVSAIFELPPELVRSQIDAVLEDIGCDAVKTGMLANRAIVEVVVAAMRRHPVKHLVVDPVMIAQSGASLLSSESFAGLLDDLLPLATLVTPNIPEAEVLVGRRIRSRGDMHEAAAELLKRGVQACLIKGGHLDDELAIDVFCRRNETRELSCPRIATSNTHGTGCQLSAAITANLALGLDLDAAIDVGKRFITTAIRHSLAIGHGNGPANPLAWMEERRLGRS